MRTTTLVEHYTTTVGSIEIIVSPRAHPPLAAEVVVEEQDTSLVLGAADTIRDTSESYETLIEKIRRQTPLSPGHILIQHPGKILAIIYDLSARPVFQPEWIAQALAEIFREMEKDRTGSLAMPLLGAEHGHYPHAAFLQVLCSTITGIPARFPERIWLVTPATACRDIGDWLQQEERMRLGQVPDKPGG